MTWNGIPVEKIDRQGNVIERYHSIEEAAEKNFMTKGAIRRRCEGTMKKRFDEDGYTFRWIRRSVIHMEFNIIEINPEFAEAVKANDGYCPCAVTKSEDTRCMCKEFRDQKEPGPCYCGRFEKVRIK